jgi:hypothetical protein
MIHGAAHPHKSYHSSTQQTIPCHPHIESKTIFPAHNSQNDMGLHQTTATAVPDSLLPLGGGDLTDTDPCWSQILATHMIPSRSLGWAIAALYVQNRANFHLAVRICTEHLVNLVPRNAAHQIRSIVSLLRTILPAIVTYNDHVALFSQAQGGRERLGSVLAGQLSRALHLPSLTIRDRCQRWYQTPDGDSYFDGTRLNIVEVLLLLKVIGVKCSGFERAAFKESLSSLTKFYFASPMRKSLKSTAGLFTPCYLVLLLEKEVVANEDTMVMFNPILGTPRLGFSPYEYEFVILPVLLDIIRIAPNDERLVATSNLGLILNALHCVDCLRLRKKILVALFVLAAIVSFPSIAIALNAPCTSFESEFPVHRGSYADVLLEVVTRATTHGSLRLSCLVVAAVVPYASRLSYSSAVSLFKLLEFVLGSGDMQLVTLVLSSIHYAVNRSIRDNVPLVIVFMKNSKLLSMILKANPAFEECDQLLSVAKNINQELKLLGSKMKSTDLERFFDDPSCERFALPVLRPPQIDFDYVQEMGQHAANLAAYYIFNEIGVVPRQPDS